jgi:hypothetical protein
MGWETVNVHLGDKRAVPAIRRDLSQRPARWLCIASKAMAKATKQEWKEWIENNPRLFVFGQIDPMLVRCHDSS